jgi:class 3 adenylate cyclase
MTPLTPLEQKLASMSGYPRVDAAFVQTLGKAIEGASDWELSRINPRDFAKAHGLDEQATVDAFLVGAKVGLFEFQFHLVCAGCGAIETTTSSWNGLVKERSWCAVCAVEVPILLDTHVEVTFSMAPSVRALHVDGYADQASYWRRFFSVSFERSEPLREFVATLFRAFVLVKGEALVKIPLTPTVGENLRVVSADAHTSVDITIEQGAPTSLTLELVPSGFVPQTATMGPGAGEIVLQNRRGVEFGVMVVADRLPEVRAILAKHPNTFRPHLTARDLLNQQRFRELFKAQTLDPALRLKLSSLTLLFTDLKGSTALYDSTGDVTAYSVVQAHFDALMAAVRNHGGAVVKTMGDAVMASFSSPADAFQAADDMMRAMGPVEERVRHLGYVTGLKVGIHEGTALAVSSDERLDYFGQTVNIAARVQALADAGEIWITDVVMNDGAVAALVKAGHFQVEQKQVALKGVGHPTDVFRVTRRAA